MSSSQAEPSGNAMSFRASLMPCVVLRPQYDPGVPWLLQLLISGCIWHAAWAAWRRCPEAPAAIGGAQAERLVGWQLMAIRAAVAILAVHCQIQLSQAFGCSGAHHHL